MPCICPARLGPLLGSLPQLPPMSALIPPVPQALLDALMPPPLALGAPALALSLTVPSASAVASASLAANLAVMANLRADVHTALGLNLIASLQGGATAAGGASLQASLSQTVGSMNAHGHLLLPFKDPIAALLHELAALMKLVQVLGAVRARFGIDLRVGGALPQLHACLAAAASASANLSARAAVLPPSLPAIPSLMASLGFAATAAGAASLTASMRALSSLALALPPLTVPLGLLATLAALLAMLAAIRSALGVNLLTPNALLSLRMALGALPLSALVSMPLTAHAAAAATATASLTAPALPALPALNLSAAASMNFAAVGSLALAMRLAAQASTVLIPAGACGLVCPVAALKVA